MSLNLPADSGPTRDAAILQRITGGDHDPVQWGTVVSDVNGHHGEFQVFADALKLDGVRFGVGARLAQQIADALDCLLLTPRLLDLMYEQAAVVLDPFPLGTEDMMGLARFEKHSGLIDDALAAAGYSAGIIQSIGKPWMLDNDLLTHPGKAENYGWHLPKGTGPYWKGVHLNPTASLPDILCIQPRSWAHGLDQEDYSEVVLLVSKACSVDGQPAVLGDVLQDPELAALASHQGALKLLRQPGA